MSTVEFKEGQKAKAWHPDLKAVVEIVFLKRDVYLPSEDLTVHTLAGVHLETDRVLAFPPQATPDIQAAIQAKALASTIAAEQPVARTAG